MAGCYLLRESVKGMAFRIYVESHSVTLNMILLEIFIYAEAKHTLQLYNNVFLQLNKHYAAIH